MLLVSVPANRFSDHGRFGRPHFWTVLAGMDAMCGLVMVLLGALAGGAAGAIAVAFGAAVLLESGLLAHAGRRGAPR